MNKVLYLLPQRPNLPVFQSTQSLPCPPNTFLMKKAAGDETNLCAFINECMPVCAHDLCMCMCTQLCVCVCVCVRAFVCSCVHICYDVYTA